MRLLLMRHASAAPTGPTDRERPLLDAGRGEAARVGRWLAAGHPVDFALVSPALRTRQTFAALGLVTAAAVRPELYNGSPDDLLRCIRDVPPQVAVLLVVAHNPGIHTLAVDLLADGHSAIHGFPPAAVCALDTQATWSDLSYGAADLAGFVTPARLAASSPS
jgi:phosphohistidine phosphatase